MTAVNKAAAAGLVTGYGATEVLSFLDLTPRPGVQGLPERFWKSDANAHSVRNPSLFVRPVRGVRRCSCLTGCTCRSGSFWPGH